MIPVATILPRKTKVQVDGGGNISGQADYWVDGNTFPGTFKGTISGQSVSVAGKINQSFSFSFTGTATCLLSKVKTDDMTTANPAGIFPASMTWTSDCQYRDLPIGGGVACIAEQLRDGLSQGSIPDDLGYTGKIPDDGAIPYISGGGHYQKKLGPYNSSGAYIGGLDCAGFTRWVYGVEFNGKDVLGWGQAASQPDKLQKDPAPGGSIGDVVYWPRPTPEGHAHVGIDIGEGYMLDEPNPPGLKSGSPPHSLRIDRISTFNKTKAPTFWRYPGS
jgi:hypothetical protein